MSSEHTVGEFRRGGMLAYALILLGRGHLVQGEIWPSMTTHISFLLAL